MENSNKSITMAEKRVGEMNKLTQGLLEQSNRYFQQRNQPKSAQNRPSAQDKQFQDRSSAPPRQNMPQNVPNRNILMQNSMPNAQLQRQNVPFRNNPPRNMQMNAPNQPQKPRFEAVGNSRQRPPQQFAPPPSPEPPKPPSHEPNKQGSLLPIPIDSDTALIAALAAVLVKEKADTKLILALLYILF